jgi:uncharacterized protein (TIGR00251 family)
MKARLSLKVRAGARRTELLGRYGDAWKLSVAAPPVDGRANDAILRFFADLAGVPLGAVAITTGHTSANKRIEIEGINAEQLERAILGAHEHPADSGSTQTPKP